MSNAKRAMTHLGNIRTASPVAPNREINITSRSGGRRSSPHKKYSAIFRLHPKRLEFPNSDSPLSLSAKMPRSSLPLPSPDTGTKLQAVGERGNLSKPHGGFQHRTGCRPHVPNKPWLFVDFLKNPGLDSGRNFVSLRHFVPNPSRADTPRGARNHSGSSSVLSVADPSKWPDSSVLSNTRSSVVSS